MTSSPRVPAGWVIVVLVCPRCGERSDAAIRVDAELRVVPGDSSLKPRMKGKAVEHKCGQIQLPDPDLDPPEPQLDFAQRAAGEGVAAPDPRYGVTSR